MKRIKEILNTPYSELTKEELNEFKMFKSHAGDLTVYEHICKELGDNNPAEKRDIEELIAREDPANSLTVAEFWRVFQFKRSMYGILMKIVEGETIKEKREAIEKMTFQERVRLVKKHIGLNK